MCPCGIRLRFVPIIKLGELDTSATASWTRKKIKLLYFSLLFSISSTTSNHDPWIGLATLTTLLETIVDTNKDYLSIHREKGGLSNRRNRILGVQ